MLMNRSIIFYVFNTFFWSLQYVFSSTQYDNNYQKSIKPFWHSHNSPKKRVFVSKAHCNRSPCIDRSGLIKLMPGPTWVDPSAAVIPQNVMYTCIGETITVDFLRLCKQRNKRTIIVRRIRSTQQAMIALVRRNVSLQDGIILDIASFSPA